MRTIVELPRPQSVKDVTIFLGLVGFFRKFIKQFSLEARPITDLKKKRVPWQWAEKEKNPLAN